MSAIYENAIDSLRIGFEFFQKESSYSSRKHAILTVFHAIEIAVVRRSGGEAEGEVVRIPGSVAQNPGDILAGDLGHAYGRSII